MKTNTAKGKRVPRNITRVNHSSFKGFRVSFQRKCYQFIFFFPAKGGNWKAAEAAALAKRDEVKALLSGKSEHEVYQLFVAHRKEREA